MAHARTGRTPGLIPAPESRKAASGLPGGPADGTCAKRLGLAARPVEELFSSVALIGQQDATTRRPGQSTSGDLIASISRQQHCSDYDLGRPMNKRVCLSYRTLLSADR